MFSDEFATIFIKVAQGCNLNCTFCVTLGNKDPIKVANLDDVKSFLQAIKKNVNPKKAAVYLHGGETFLAGIPYLKSVCTLIDEILCETECVKIAQTNLLYQFGDELIGFVKEYCNGELGVSWDADVRFNSEVQERQFFKNIDRCISEKLSVAVAIVAQKQLLKRNPIDVIKQFDGCNTIDFEHLSVFDDATKALAVSNKDWSDWVLEIVKYYGDNETTWALPIVDLFTESLQSGSFFEGKVNCDPTSTFTLNANGTCGLCPDTTYSSPLSTAKEMNSNWSLFEEKCQETILERKYNLAQQCYSCEFYSVCGGNMEPELFSGDDECPLSKASIQYQQENIEIFAEKLKSAKCKIAELK